MNTCTPNSRTSTVWRLTVKTAECPDFLRDIVRILRNGWPLVLQHPDARQRLQCLRCGNMGHTVARSRYTDSQLTGPGGRVATEQEVARLEDLAKPFVSLEEVKQTAVKRLALQEAADRNAQEAIQPRQTATKTSPSNKGGGKHSPNLKRIEAASDHQVVGPEPTPPSIELPKSNSGSSMCTKKHTSKNSTCRSQCTPTLQYPDDEEDENDKNKNQEGKSEEQPPQPGVIEISSDDELEDKQLVPITAAEKAKLMKEKPPKEHPTPRLVALKQCERQALQTAKDNGPVIEGVLEPLPELTQKRLSDFSSIQKSLQLQPASTPPPPQLHGYSVGSCCGGRQSR